MVRYLEFNVVHWLDRLAPGGVAVEATGKHTNTHPGKPIMLRELLCCVFVVVFLSRFCVSYVFLAVGRDYWVLVGFYYPLPILLIPI